MPVLVAIIPALMFAMLAGCAAESNPRVEDYNQYESLPDSIWYSLEAAQEKAGEENKKVMVFVYTDWCGYCRRMDREVYTDDQVIETFSEYYYPVRLNAESDKKVTFNGQNYAESELALAFGVTSYPTVVFVDETGDPFGSQPGFIERNVFRDILVFVGSNAYRSQSFQDFQRK